MFHIPRGVWGTVGVIWAGFSIVANGVTGPLTITCPAKQQQSVNKYIHGE